MNPSHLSPRIMSPSGGGVASSSDFASIVSSTDSTTTATTASALPNSNGGASDESSSTAATPRHIKAFKTEYKAQFQPFDQYAYDQATDTFVKNSHNNTSIAVSKSNQDLHSLSEANMTSLQGTTQEAGLFEPAIGTEHAHLHCNEPWYKEVVKRKEQANEYRYKSEVGHSSPLLTVDQQQRLSPQPHDSLTVGEQTTNDARSSHSDQLRAESPRESRSTHKVVSHVYKRDSLISNMANNNNFNLPKDRFAPRSQSSRRPVAKTATSSRVAVSTTNKTTTTVSKSHNTTPTKTVAASARPSTKAASSIPKSTPTTKPASTARPTPSKTTMRPTTAATTPRSTNVTPKAPVKKLETRRVPLAPKPLTNGNTGATRATGRSVANTTTSRTTGKTTAAAPTPAASTAQRSIKTAPLAKAQAAKTKTLTSIAAKGAPSDPSPPPPTPKKPEFEQDIVPVKEEPLTSGPVIDRLPMQGGFVDLEPKLETIVKEEPKDELVEPLVESVKRDSLVSHESLKIENFQPQTSPDLVQDATQNDLREDGGPLASSPDIFDTKQPENSPDIEISHNIDIHPTASEAKDPSNEPIIEEQIRRSEDTVELLENLINQGFESQQPLGITPTDDNLHDADDLKPTSTTFVDSDNDSVGEIEHARESDLATSPSDLPTNLHDEIEESLMDAQKAIKDTCVDLSGDETHEYNQVGLHEDLHQEPLFEEPKSPESPEIENIVQHEKQLEVREQISGKSTPPESPDSDKHPDILHSEETNQQAPQTDLLLNDIPQIRHQYEEHVSSPEILDPEDLRESSENLNHEQSTQQFEILEPEQSKSDSAEMVNFDNSAEENSAPLVTSTDLTRSYEILDLDDSKPEGGIAEKSSDSDGSDTVNQITEPKELKGPTPTPEPEEAKETASESSSIVAESAVELTSPIKQDEAKLEKLLDGVPNESRESLAESIGQKGGDLINVDFETSEASEKPSFGSRSDETEQKATDTCQILEASALLKYLEPEEPKETSSQKSNDDEIVNGLSGGLVSVEDRYGSTGSNENVHQQQHQSDLSIDDNSEPFSIMPTTNIQQVVVGAGGGGEAHQAAVSPVVFDLLDANNLKEIIPDDSNTVFNNNQSVTTKTPDLPN